MKRIVYLLAIVGVVFTGCDPVEDINNDLAAQEEPIIGEAEYILTDEDYADLGLDFGSFDSEDDAKTLLPPFLTELYPIWGEGSAVTVGYQLYIGSAEGVSDFTGSDVYSLANSDYALTGSDAFGFYPDVDATDEIPTVLDANIVAPSEGQIVLAEYKQYTEIPEVGLADLVAYNFASGLEGWSIVEESGADDIWTNQSGYIQGNGYFGMPVANAEWLISPSIDLTGESNLKLQITQEIDFLSLPDQIDILVSADYTGDPEMATWTAVDFDKTAFGSMTTSEAYDFSAYDDEIITIAFKYTSTDSDAGRWRIADLAIKTLGATGDTDSKGEYFMFEGGEWEVSEDVYYLSSSDYNSMGEESGQPGRYDNFSSSTPAADYLDTFLGINYPFAQEEDEIFVIYKYFSSNSGLGTRGNLYAFTDGEWVGHQSTISTSLQFGNDGTTWVPDNTIRYTFSGEDVTFISNAFIDIYPGPADNVGFFGSFDRRSASSNYWSDDMLLEAFNALLENGNFITDEEQKYVLTYIIYNGSTTDETKSVIKMGGEWVYQ